MGRAFSVLMAIAGFGLIALGLWVTLQFEKMPDAPFIIRRHPASESGDKLVIAGALCLIGAAINRSRGP